MHSLILWGTCPTKLPLIYGLATGEVDLEVIAYYGGHIRACVTASSKIYTWTVIYCMLE